MGCHGFSPFPGPNPPQQLDALAGICFAGVGFSPTRVRRFKLTAAGFYLVVQSARSRILPAFALARKLVGLPFLCRQGFRFQHTTVELQPI
jgi:hypothetical protein